MPRVKTNIIPCDFTRFGRIFNPSVSIFIHCSLHPHSVVDVSSAFTYQLPFIHSSAPSPAIFTLTTDNMFLKRLQNNSQTSNSQTFNSQTFNSQTFKVEIRKLSTHKRSTHKLHATNFRLTHFQSYKFTNLQSYLQSTNLQLTNFRLTNFQLTNVQRSNFVSQTSG